MIMEILSFYFSSIKVLHIKCNILFFYPYKMNYYHYPCENL